MRGANSDTLPRSIDGAIGTLLPGVPAQPVFKRRASTFVNLCIAFATITKVEIASGDMATTDVGRLSTNSTVATKGCTVTASVSTPRDKHTISFSLGEGQAAPWLESSILGLKEGSVANIVDPNSQAVQIHLLRVSHPTDDLPPVPTRDQYLRSAERYRTSANEGFKKSKGSYKEIRASIIDYNRALDMVRKGKGETQMALRLFNNLALCYFRTGDWTTCTAMCDAALEIDETCAKAYYRRALAAAELDQVVRAVADMRAASRLAPDDQLVQKESRRIEAEAQRVTQTRRNEFAEVYSRKPQSIAFSDLIPN